MTRTARRILAAAVLAAAGCSAEPAPQAPAVVKGPHDGTTLRLPDDQGFAEIVNEPEPSGRSRDETTALVVYFLQADGKTPISPAPSDVKFEAKSGKQAAKTLALAAEPKSDDAAGAARFATKPGPYSLADLRGRLSASVGGKDVSVDYAGAR
jgi:hypothetical protein